MRLDLFIISVNYGLLKCMDLLLLLTDVIYLYAINVYGL